MKKLVLAFSVLAFVACNQGAPKDYVTFSGKVENKNSDSLFVFQGKQFSKTIKVNEDGTFSDTLKVNKGIYGIYDGKKSVTIFLKNGYDLNVTVDAKELGESLKFSGEGSESNNFLVKKALMQKNLINPNILELEEKEFNAELTKIEKKLYNYLDENSKGLDSTLLANQKKEIAQFIPSATRAFKQQKGRTTQYASFVGKPSPAFNFENVKGGKTTLSSLKGKYVYVDVWATWCGPCIREIPALQQVEKDFHNKNIEFVSVSVDDGRGFKGDAVAAKEGWKKMVANKNLGGIQLISDKGWKSEFVQGYGIRGIPRFILIDPSGNIVDADAPRPSSPKLRTLLNGLKNI